MSRRSKKPTRARRSTRAAAAARPKVVTIIGATGSGKSALALRLARRFGGVIIAADSRTIYRGLDVGTAKPTRAERRSIPHYGLDLVRPSQRYSAAEFQRYVYRVVQQVHRRQPQRPIFLVGGTMLYVDAVLKGLDFSAAPPNPTLRKRLEQLSTEVLRTRLRGVDPKTAARIDQHNRRRLVRALEVALTTHKSFYGSRRTSPPAWDTLALAVSVPARVLEQRQRRRIDQMFRAGWESEVRRLLRRYPHAAPGLSALGYPEVVSYIRGERSLATTKEAIRARTRQITKRQLAWFKTYRAEPVAPHAYATAVRLVANFLK